MYRKILDVRIANSSTSWRNESEKHTVLTRMNYNNCGHNLWFHPVLWQKQTWVCLFDRFPTVRLVARKVVDVKKNPFLCTTQQSFACWWIAPEIRLMLELIGRQYTEGKLFSVLEIKCSVSYSGKRGADKGSSLAAISSKSTHPSRVCVVFCLRPVGYQICCWILYAIVSFKSRYVLNEKQLEM